MSPLAHRAAVTIWSFFESRGYLRTTDDKSIPALVKDSLTEAIATLIDNQFKQPPRSGWLDAVISDPQSLERIAVAMERIADRLSHGPVR